ncbi:alpha/beta fold hydrolase [Paenibacillus puerhi]|uniref:alpha/beta fold hydrolase n=1 Tax=Paenibacillus puerhi TaxID=2692622 RepID=UPI00135BA14C|nr:alpha/beta hydrolase [Paenibacillus puerhi]
MKHAALILATSFLIIGAIWQTMMLQKESRLFLPQGEIYSVNSHDRHVYGVGEGKPTLVFVAGSGTPSAFTDYYELQSELMPYARTVSYDRAGFGWSEPTKIPRTVDILVEELHELLQKANETPPYILVGHSLGALEVIHYAQTYPSEVQGILVLDGGSPEYYAHESEMKSYFINRVMAGLRVTGVARALGNAGLLLPFTGENLRYERLPNEVKALDAAMFYKHLGESGNLSFIKNMSENAQLVMDRGYLKDIPLVILSSDSGKSWEKVQQQLLHWSNDSYQETLPQSQHYIHWSNKEAVITKILDMLDAKEE